MAGICYTPAPLANTAQAIRRTAPRIHAQLEAVGGTGAKIFTVAADTGAIRASRPLAIDFRKSSYTLILQASDGAHTSPQQSVTITIPNRVKTCLYGIDVTTSKAATPVLLVLGATLGSCRAP